MRWKDPCAGTLPTLAEAPAGPVESVLLREGGYRVEVLRTTSVRKQAYRLRHRLFAETLRWVPEDPSGLEVDAYDLSAEMVGVLDPAGRLLGQARLHGPRVPFMLEEEFAGLVGGSPFIRTRDLAEITRFGVDPEARGVLLPTAFGPFDLFTALLVGVYRWCRRGGIRHLAAVTDHRVLRLLRSRGFPFEPMGDLVTMPDGVRAVAVRMDWEGFRDANRLARPALAAWSEPPGDPPILREVRSIPSSRRWPRPGSGSPHPASAGRC